MSVDEINSDFFGGAANIFQLFSLFSKGKSFQSFDTNGFH